VQTWRRGLVVRDRVRASLDERADVHLDRQTLVEALPARCRLTWSARGCPVVVSADQTSYPAPPLKESGIRYPLIG